MAEHHVGETHGQRIGCQAGTSVVPGLVGNARISGGPCAAGPGLARDRRIGRGPAGAGDAAGFGRAATAAARQTCRATVTSRAAGRG